ncbi:hypothetical protein REPUB_Repub07fG0124500 [Reevesia pubescens]
MGSCEYSDQRSILFEMRANSTFIVIGQKRAFDKGRHSALGSLVYMFFLSIKKIWSSLSRNTQHYLVYIYQPPIKSMSKGKRRDSTRHFETFSVWTKTW